MEEEPVTSRKPAGLWAERRSERLVPVARLPAPPPSASGFAQALRSTELTVNVVTSGTLRGGEERARQWARTPWPPVPVLPTPPSLICCFILPFGKERGCPVSGCA